MSLPDVDRRVVAAPDSNRALVASVVRGALFPLRWAVTSLPRGSFLRSACVPPVKWASTRRALLAGLSEVRPLDRRDISFEATDSMVLDDVFWFGAQGYEGVLAEVWAALCADASSVLEIGANIGFYSVIGAKSCRGRYTAVEPIPENAAVLRANLRRNRLEHVDVIEGAAIDASTRREVVLNVPDEGRAAPVGAHLLIGSEVSARSQMRTATVAGFPMRDLAEGRDLIKIDAEGIEHALLSGVMQYLLDNRPSLVVEVLPESTRLAAVLKDLARAGGYGIKIVCGYGSDAVIAVSAEEFTAPLVARHHSKDVVLVPTPSPSHSASQ
jgi:FkbM family methyltransferase